MKKVLCMLSFCACFLLMGMTHAQDVNAVSGSSSASQSKVNAAQQQGNEQVLQQNYTDSGHMTYGGSYAVHANPGVALQGPGMAYSNWNCANGTAAGGSSFWASFSWSGSKESTACNFRANAALHAQMDNTPNVSAAARASMNMADFWACTHSGKKIERGCIMNGLIVNADTPATTSQSEWYACHASERLLQLCKQAHMLSRSEQVAPAVQ